MQQLVEYLTNHIPLTRHIQIEAGELTSAWLELKAPLEPNWNDKNTGFGGTLATLCTLAGWCVVSKLCQEQALDIDISVTESQIQYHSPVTSDPIAARASFPEEAERALFIETLKAEGKSAISISVAIWVEGREAVTFNSRYHAKLLATRTTKR